jgi:hypothetical protein
MTKIIIPNKENLYKLLQWRDDNKPLVRDFKTPINEGVIVYSDSFWQYFKQSGSIVEHEYRAGDFITGLKFKYDFSTWKTSEVEIKTETFYPKDDSIQDMITVHASLMALLYHCPENFTMNEDKTEIVLNL